MAAAQAAPASDGPVGRGVGVAGARARPASPPARPGRAPPGGPRARPARSCPAPPRRRPAAPRRGRAAGRGGAAPAGGPRRASRLRSSPVADSRKRGSSSSQAPSAPTVAGSAGSRVEGGRSAAAAARPAASGRSSQSASPPCLRSDTRPSKAWAPGHLPARARAVEPDAPDVDAEAVEARRAPPGRAAPGRKRPSWSRKASRWRSSVRSRSPVRRQLEPLAAARTRRARPGRRPPRRPARRRPGPRPPRPGVRPRDGAGRGPGLGGGLARGRRRAPPRRRRVPSARRRSRSRSCRSESAASEIPTGPSGPLPVAVASAARQASSGRRGRPLGGEPGHARGEVPLPRLAQHGHGVAVGGEAVGVEDGGEPGARREPGHVAEALLGERAEEGVELPPDLLDARPRPRSFASA